MTLHQHEAPAGHDWAGDLRAKGLRVTPARVAVLEALRGRGHATPEQVHTLVDTAAITLSTVYRTLDALAEAGLVAHTHLAGHQASWSLAATAHHAHLVCRDCGRVTALDHALADRLAADLLQRHGFEADLPHLSIFGRCADCATAQI